jgi:Neuraminidase (sialidase)
MPVGIHISPVLLSDRSLISIGTEKIADKFRLSVYKSDDTGASWYKTCEIPSPLNPSGYPVINENHIIELSPGRLLALFRAEAFLQVKEENGFLRQSISNDNGYTWSSPLATPIYGYPAHLLRLRDGRILCSYSRRRAPYSIEAVISEDDGKSWNVDHTMVLHRIDDEADMGYPSSIELTDGEIMTVFYVSRCDVNLPESHLSHHYQLPGSSPEGIIAVRFKIS